MHIPASRCVVGSRPTRTLSDASSNFMGNFKCRWEFQRVSVSIYALQQKERHTANTLQRTGTSTASVSVRPIGHDDPWGVRFICPCGRFSHGCRGFATKRQRLDEYDSYEVTVDPKKVPHDFCRVPIHMQSAGELKDTITVAGRMRLFNPNFWRRCSSAVRDLAEGFRSREIVAILNAYAKAGYRDVSLFGRLGQLLALQAHDCRASDMGVALQAFARLNIPNSSLFDLLAVQCIRKVDELGPRGIATVAAAYGGVKHPHPLLFGRLAQQIEAQVETFCNLDLIQALWGCARVSYRHAKLLDCCADQIMHRLATCTVTEALTAAESFAVLSFYRADLVGSLSSFFRSRICNIPVRSLPLLLQTFASFDQLASLSADPRVKLLPVLHVGNAEPLTNSVALYRAALPVIARAAVCFSLTELSAVDSTLRSVGLSHDLLTSALQQELQQRVPHWTPQVCAEILQQVASRGGDGNDKAAAAAVRALLASPAVLGSLPETTVLQILKDLKDLRCHGALAVAASFVYGGSGLANGERLLGGAELLVAQRIVLQCFPSTESFVDGYREGFLSEAFNRPESTRGSEGGSVACLEPSCEQECITTALSEKARMLYASISSTAEAVGANALVLAICRYRSDPGVCLWLDLLMKGLVTEVDPELLPALLRELARMKKERAAAEEEDYFVAPDSCYAATSQAEKRLPQMLSSAQLSRRFCRVARYLMESPLPGAAAHSMQQAPTSSQCAATHEGFLYGRLSVVAAGSAAQVLRSHPKPEVAQRYVEQLCDIVCSRLQRAQTPAAAGYSGAACSAHLEWQVGKSLARLLQSLVALRADVPPALVQQLAPRLQWLEGRDVLAALRLLPTPTEASLRQQITRAVDLRFRDLKSWRMLGELRDLCADLKLEVDDDVAELDVDVSRYQEEDDGEEGIPTIGDAVCNPEEDHFSAERSNLARHDAEAWK